ncbi:50S ribosomal protein L29 [Wohlfahrtiimonas chitiniclastica]|nr:MULTISPECIES: 50S ribosomal protein L29 [Wohlfahrtiimonas]MBS7814396.1 50S ribosomal protein L29 [Wohlfahrtiimonas chitiniclastica]MBS7816417.1 50S ribosomal protein L29 [Wohlfahrtiimonas chitiniclastica]MBS7818464.1 50S ribosomal protein L29 [Wohlfahrtiimonas chitiniclastica]MBS7820270.1 50S ribosomal protein L29 [Wohlfahrtiimonas chitiniclastica]MBS7822666.1 50S ribosomal protein L29 [Wohlfahrtiimonas chitiniclastica]
MEELSAKSVDELKKERLELRKAQFNLRMQKATGQLEKPHLFKAVRKQIAQINTVLAQKAGE